MIEAHLLSLYSPDGHSRQTPTETMRAGSGPDNRRDLLQPGEGKFEFVMTVATLTMRCDGNSVDHVRVFVVRSSMATGRRFRRTADTPGTWSGIRLKRPMQLFQCGTASNALKL